MSGKAKVAGATAALAALLAGSAQGVSFNYAKIEFADFRRGPIEGVTVAGYRAGSRRVDVRASLHALPVTKEGSSEFLLLASRKPCSQAVDAADFVVWQTSIATSDDDVFHRDRVRRRGSSSRARSIRLFLTSDPQGPFQQACGRIISDKSTPKL